MIYDLRLLRDRLDLLLLLLRPFLDLLLPLLDLLRDLRLLRLPLILLTKTHNTCKQLKHSMNECAEYHSYIMICHFIC